MVIANPFARSQRDGVDLNELLHSNPEQGNAKLDDYVEETRRELRDAVSEGVCYILEGARAGCCSPMQYGGYYLERDRELLEVAKEQSLTVLFVQGGDDLYLDFVSDLPADIFAWDSKASGFDSEYVRGLRDGAQASMDPNSEIELQMSDAVAGASRPQASRVALERGQDDPATSRTEAYV